MIQEAAACARVARADHWIAGGMHDKALLMILRRNLPYLFQADTVVLRIAVFVELKFFDDLLAQMPTAALGKYRVFRMEFEAGLVGGFVLSVRSDAHVSSGHAFNAAVLVIKHLSCGKTREHLGAKLHRLLAQPGAQITQGDDVVALIVHRLWNQQVREFYCGLSAGEVVNVVARHRGVEWCTALFPIGE